MVVNEHGRSGKVDSKTTTPQPRRLGQPAEQSRPRRLGLATEVVLEPGVIRPMAMVRLHHPVPSPAGSQAETPADRAAPSPTRSAASSTTPHRADPQLFLGALASVERDAGPTVPSRRAATPFASTPVVSQRTDELPANRPPWSDSDSTGDTATADEITTERKVGPISKVDPRIPLVARGEGKDGVVKNDQIEDLPMLMAADESDEGMLESDSISTTGDANMPTVSFASAAVRSDQVSRPIDIPPPTTHGPMGGRLGESRYRASQLPEFPQSEAPLSDTDLPDVLNDPRLASDDDGSQGSIAGVAEVFGDQPIEFNVWWQAPMTGSIGLSKQSLPIDVASLTHIALASSPYIQGILTEPKIRQNDLVIADSEFDSLAFVEAKFADTNEPVGSDLTTGDNSDRFLDETLSSAAGLRKKNRNGSSLEMIQRGGFQDNNSTFLNPNPQGTTRLEINFTQPLLRDQGRAVNTTRVCLASIDIQLANSDVREKLQDHLLDVTRAYWNLYAARAEWLQRNRLLQSATELHGILAARREVDSHQRQILRAKGAVASRRSDLVRAETRIRNAQARLRLLTGDPKLIEASRWELTPQDLPLTYPVRVSTREATLTALDNRPDIASAIRKIQAVSLRVGAAKNQVLPRLDMILSTYVAGLDSNTDTFGALVNQFSDGRPSYAAGLLFEMPLGNRASRARLARNRWTMTRTLYEFQQTTEATFTEVEVAVRETQTAFDEMFAKYQAIEAAKREVDYLQQRWELLPDPNESAILLIENLLDSQERLADEERAFTRSQVDYAISWVLLRKAMGVLLNFEQVGGDDSEFGSEIVVDRPLPPPADQTEIELAAPEGAER